MFTSLKTIIVMRKGVKTNHLALLTATFSYRTQITITGKEMKRKMMDKLVAQYLSGSYQSMMSVAIKFSPVQKIRSFKMAIATRLIDVHFFL